jgi:hypothetical protein
LLGHDLFLHNVVYPHLIVDESDSPIVFLGWLQIKGASYTKTKAFYDDADGSENAVRSQAFGSALSRGGRRLNEALPPPIQDHLVQFLAHRFHVGVGKGTQYSRCDSER